VIHMSASERAAAAKAIGELADNLREDRESWENPTLEGYLDALERWLDDYGRSHPLVEPSWEFIGFMLQSAKIYE
jgi:hypothetical protein